MTPLLYTALQQIIFLEQEKAMSILNLFPVALAVAALVLRWYVCAPARRQSAATVVRIDPKKNVARQTALKRPNAKLHGQMLAEAATA
jgi:hypothetical protein